MVGIIVKNYAHFNNAMGKHITSKAHYEKEMVKGGYITYEQSERIASQVRREQRKDYKPSQKMIDIVNTAKNSAKKGKVKLSDRTIDAMKSMGIDIKAHHKGGFSA